MSRLARRSDLPLSSVESSRIPVRPLLRLTNIVWLETAPSSGYQYSHAPAVTAPNLWELYLAFATPPSPME
jgi:hypothetical protein